MAPVSVHARAPRAYGPAEKRGDQHPRGGALFRPHLRGRTGRDFNAASNTAIRMKSPTRPNHMRCTSSIRTSKPGFGLAKSVAPGAADLLSYRLQGDLSNPGDALSLASQTKAKKGTIMQSRWRSQGRNSTCRRNRSKRAGRCRRASKTGFGAERNIREHRC